MVAAALNIVATLERKMVEQPDDAEIRAGLERVVASRAFGKSPQLANFLRFVVDMSLAGNGHRVKAYTIATDALGRDASFDPQHDPIVRVEAVRLRRALKTYYATDGRDDPIVIAMRSGSYVPTFQRHRHCSMQRLRRQSAGLIRENYRLVMLIAVIATTVSLGLDLLGGMFISTTQAPAQEVMRASQPAMSAADTTTGMNADSGRAD
jgi:hypothetical protein